MIAAAVLLPTASYSQQLNDTITPAERPYPYQILDKKPGIGADEAKAHYQERAGVKLGEEKLSISVQAPNGRAFAFDYPSRLITPSVTMYTRMGDEAYTEVNLSLATEVLGGRLTTISRTMRKPLAELPDGASLQAQLEKLYGKPSRVKFDDGYEIIYAWGEKGFIPDLDAEPQIEVKYEGFRGVPTTENFRVCQGFVEAAYKFEQFRKPIAPGCVAELRVVVRDKPPNRTVSFGLYDYDLIRQSHMETDKQIKDSLLGEAKASDLDL